MTRGGASASQNFVESDTESEGKRKYTAATGAQDRKISIVLYRSIEIYWQTTTATHTARATVVETAIHSWL